MRLGWIDRGLRGLARIRRSRLPRDRSIFRQVLECGAPAPLSSCARVQRISGIRNATGPSSTLPKASSVVRWCCAVCAFAVGLACIISPSPVLAAEPIRATLGKETAWVGEGVPMIITLYSPGPFSGTPSFDLPELSRTVLVKAGSPLVGSEEVDGESFFTQRHEFRLFTQRSGEVVVPPFGVRFFGKRTFVAEAEPVEGITPELRWESKRPPGAADSGLVLSTTSVEIEQRWSPDPRGAIEAGDVVVRTVTRKAQGTSAMLLPPVSTNGPAGVRVYLGTPTVQDSSERGQSAAERSDTVKYQFLKGGTFVLPELTFAWWDPERGELRRESLAGVTADVAPVSPVASGGEGMASGSGTGRWAGVLAGLLFLGCCVWFCRRRLERWVLRWRAWHNRPEARAVRDLRTACATNDAFSAHRALLTWLAARRSVGVWPVAGAVLTGVGHQHLREEWEMLSRYLYGASRPAEPWQGRALWLAFDRSRRRLDRRPLRSGSSVLPTLNPGPKPC